MQGSLAYFAKGPLSRARSAFHLDLESSLDMADLIEFLKSMILTTVQIDKKYRETIPDVIAKMGEHINSSDEGGRRKRKSKKMRLGKNGLYPVEEEDVCRWWTSNKPELSDDQTGFSAAQIKSHVSLLRTRETQLQMILILEILALEPLKSSADTGDACLPALPGTDTSVQLPSMAPPPKKRNKHNLPVLIDVHADRLTIWQSTAFDDILLLGDSQVSQVSADGQGLLGFGATPDILLSSRQFVAGPRRKAGDIGPPIPGTSPERYGREASGPLGFDPACSAFRLQGGREPRGQARNLSPGREDAHLSERKDRRRRIPAHRGTAECPRDPVHGGRAQAPAASAEERGRQGEGPRAGDAGHPCQEKIPPDRPARRASAAP